MFAKHALLIASFCLAACSVTGDDDQGTQESALVSPDCNCPCSNSGCDPQGFCIVDPMPDGTACTMLTKETGGTCSAGECTLASSSAGTCASPQETGNAQTEPIPSSGCKDLLSSALTKLKDIGGCSTGWDALCTCFNGFGLKAVSADCEVTIANHANTKDKLTLTVAGLSGQSVSSAPSGLVVASGSTASHAFATGTRVTLSVSNGHTAIWSGVCSSGGAKAKTCAFTITAAASEHAKIQ